MKRVVLGVGGGIAAYKSAALCSLLMKRGYKVQVLMTEHATRFIQPLTFQSLSKHPVLVDTFIEPNPEEIAHIAVADRADVYVIAPATANLIAKLAYGIADDMVTTTALAMTCPLIIAPAMNVHMYQHPTVQENIQRLRQRGVVIVDPASGPLACGYTGKGRLAEPEDIADVVEALQYAKQDLKGLHLTVTAGPTIEEIDPVRYLTNASSGKMGYAIAEAAVARGAEVVLVSGPTHLSAIAGVKMLKVRSTDEMLAAVQQVISATDVFISAAAPADFKPVQKLHHKWKKSSGIPSLELTATPDILATVARTKVAQQIFVGFAAETENILANGFSKLQRKRLDLLVANNVTDEGAGFAVDTNRVTFIWPDETSEVLPVLSKYTVADEILNRVKKLRQQ